MLYIEQAGEHPSPIMKIIRGGGSELFGEGASDRRILVYEAGSVPTAKWPSILRQHAGGGIVVLDRSAEAAVLRGDDLANLVAEIGFIEKVVIAVQNYDCVATVNSYGDDRLRAVFFHSFLRSMNWTAQALARDAGQWRTLVERRSPAANGKLYSCLLNRARPHRLAIFGWLKERGYLERGHVSFHGAELLADRDRFEKVVELGRRDFPSFGTEISSAMQMQFPFVNFPPDFLTISDFNTKIDITAYDAPVSLIAESEMTNMRRYTEKSLKGFIAGHRPVIAGNVGVCRLLKDIGFMFPGFDTGYDEIKDGNDRLVSVLERFERYMEMPEGERRDWIEGTWATCFENMEAFVANTGAVIKRSFENLARTLETRD